jgi:hypothetical protein
MVKSFEVANLAFECVGVANNLSEKVKGEWNNNFEIFIFDDGSVLKLTNKVRAFVSIDDFYITQESFS